jgi:signal transduction histidine kinase
MSPLRRPRTVGLRARLVAALLFTSAVTLGIAALALLPPLERRLRRDDLQALVTAAAAFRPQLEDLELTVARPGNPELAGLARSLERKTGAHVVVFNDQLQPLVGETPPRPRGTRVADTDLPRDRYSDVARAIATRQEVSSTTGSSPNVARVALPLRIGGRNFAVALRQRLGGVTVAVNVVKRAFVTGALAGLAIAVLLGFGLATTLLRRLRRLRDAALRLGERGLAADVPEDRSRDEVGDLGRAFSSMQKRLRRQEDARRRFVSTASHELRTPLASLSGVLEMLDDDLTREPADLDDGRRQVARARVQSRRLAALAADLLDLSRLDADVELRREPVELGELSRAAVSEFDVRVAEEGVGVEVAAPDSPVWAMADPGAVARIVRILVDNALRFTPNGTPVRVSLATSDGKAAIAVADAGPGVPDAEREMIFERFQRGTATGGEGGFGLGLAIGRELAERMSGELLLEQNSPGSRFVLRVPAATPPA